MRSDRILSSSRRFHIGFQQTPIGLYRIPGNGTTVGSSVSDSHEILQTDSLQEPISGNHRILQSKSDNKPTISDTRIQQTYYRNPSVPMGFYRIRRKPTIGIRINFIHSVFIGSSKFLQANIKSDKISTSSLSSTKFTPVLRPTSHHISEKTISKLLNTSILRVYHYSFSKSILST